MLTALLLAGIAAAQSTHAKSVDWHVFTFGSASATNPTAFFGRESDAGSFDRANQTHRGNRFVLTSGGKANTTSLTVSFDAAPIDHRNSSKVVGGNWTLIIHKRGVYVGSIFGDIPEGRIDDQIDSLKGTSLQRAIHAPFRVKGGLGAYEKMLEEQTPSFEFTSTTS